MASSPEQEISQEVVKTATRHFAWWLAHPDHDDHDWLSAMRSALAAVLPDLQRPLLEKIEDLREYHAALESTNRKLAFENRQLEAERDARPDLTAEEIGLAIAGCQSLLRGRAESHIADCDRCQQSRALLAKLERSLDAHKP